MLALSCSGAILRRCVLNCLWAGRLVSFEAAILAQAWITGILAATVPPALSSLHPELPKVTNLKGGTAFK